MTTKKRMFAGCLLLPVLLVASCAGKMTFDNARYHLPGEVLKSSVQPTRQLDTATKVAETLDAYVQPRFEILRDKNFGISRIVFRKHAGIVQLKVDTPQEQELIANVNAANRDYAINLLHCAPKPDRGIYSVTPELQMLYFNQQQVASSYDFGRRYGSEGISDAKFLEHITWESIAKKSIAALPTLMKGKEYRTKDASWELLMRPVLAANQECLSCHTNAKLNDTLGVMVYAVRDVTRNASAKISLR